MTLVTPNQPTQPLDYENRHRRQYETRLRRQPWWRRWRPSWEPVVTACVISFILLSAGFSLLVGLTTSRTPDRRMACRKNLRQIGAAVVLYAQNHRGALPADLGSLLAPGMLNEFTLVCTSSGDRPASGATTQAIAQDLKNPGRCSYVLAPALPTNVSGVTPAHVLAYEPLKNHSGRSANVLFGDFHAEWLDAPAANHVIAELIAGFNPPGNPQPTTNPVAP